MQNEHYPFREKSGTEPFPIILNSDEMRVIMGKNQVLFLSQTEESKMAKQVHIRVDDDIYKELSDYSVVSGQSMQD